MIEKIIASGLNKLNLENKKVLALIPDRTRTAPVGSIVKIVYGILHELGAKLDLLVALGTHHLLSTDDLLVHLDMTDEDYVENYKDMKLFQHTWNDPASLVDIGELPDELIHQITDGLMAEAVKITINRRIFNYDHILIIGPVFPHEVAGFSGGNKYIFPGISGPEIIDFFHWLGAVITNLKIIGIPDNPVRKVIDESVKLVKLPVSAISLVIQENKLSGIYIGSVKESWASAVEQSSKLHIIRKQHTFHRVLACAPLMYDDIWTAGKCMYKCEHVVSDEGELIIYGPHIGSLSHTYGHIMEKIGYHVADYYLKQPDCFSEVPRVAKAVSTYLKGAGFYENGVEKVRIRVSLSTGISAEVCEKVNLGYVNPNSINLDEWRDQEEQGILLVKRAGEILYLL